MKTPTLRRILRLGHKYLLRISPLMIDEASDRVLENELNRMTKEVNIEALRMVL